MRNKSFIINYLCRQSCTDHPTIGTAFAQMASGIVESGTEKIALARVVGVFVDSIEIQNRMGLFLAHLFPDIQHQIASLNVEIDFNILT